MAKTQKTKEIIRTGVIIGIIYIAFLLYLFFVSDRVEKLDARSKDEKIEYSLKIGE